MLILLQEIYSEFDVLPDAYNHSICYLNCNFMVSDWLYSLGVHTEAFDDIKLSPSTNYECDIPTRNSLCGICFRCTKNKRIDVRDNYMYSRCYDCNSEKRIRLPFFNKPKLS